jgi:hypothetical protein
MYEGVPNLAALWADPTRKLLILDDLMTTIKCKDLNAVFCQGSHHWNMSVIHITQNAFYGGMRTARINSHYLFLLKNPADKLQVMTLARQMYPKKQQFFLDAFEDATARPFGYLLVDLESTTDDRIRLRTNIFDYLLRSALIQKGNGFFAPLLIPALTTIASLIGEHLIRK